MNFERMKAVALKEKTHIWRDPFTLIMAIVMPVFLVFLFGLALDLDVKNIEIGIDDRDHSYSSRRLISIFVESRSFIVINKEKKNLSDHEKEIRNENIKAILIIPHNFEKDIKSKKMPFLQFIADGSDNAILGPALSYLYGIQLQMRQELFEENFSQNIKIETRFLYNGELKSTYFIVPGLMSVVCAL
ncbi:MAG: ABC transporter permease [Oligoflexia bacterium]|nr:ABC transporter permease [Oligoflexia bacterium]